MCMTQESTGHHTTQSSTETAGEGFRRNYQEATS